MALVGSDYVIRYSLFMNDQEFVQGSLLMNLIY